MDAIVNHLADGEDRKAFEAASAESRRLRPLGVDLDGTLIRTDLLHESIFALLSKNFLSLFLMPFWLLKGKAYFKSRIAAVTPINAATLPYNDALLALLRRDHAAGRRLVLITASNQRYADAVAAHLGLFEAAYGSDDKTNLTGEAKAAKLRELFGERGFDYAGNARADLAVWESAHTAIAVGASPDIQKILAQNGAAFERLDGARPKLADYLRALRPHQWTKNLLVFLPLFLDHKIHHLDQLANASLAFLAFSACASSVYLLNDMLDLGSDRKHPSKRKRPFAAGAIPLAHGAIIAPLLLAAGAGFALLLPPAFGVILAIYYAATLLYSFHVKRRMLADVFLLAGLYTLRIIGGSAAVSSEHSFWLLAFSVFFFLSLALVKRYVELTALTASGDTKAPGRGYTAVDLAMLPNFGVSSGYMSVLVLALYINSNEIKMTYKSPEVIWLVCPIVLYFLSRIWLLARRGELHDDPVVFAITNPKSLLLVAISAALLWLGRV